MTRSRKASPPGRRWWSALTILAVVASSFVLGGGTAAAAGDSYVDCSAGSAGDGSSGSPWNSLSAVNSRPGGFGAGDRVLFRRGTTCTGQLAPSGSGSAGSPIVVDAYGDGDAPVIAGNGAAQAVLLLDQDYWTLQNLQVTNAAGSEGDRHGILVRATDSAVHRGIVLRNLLVRDVSCTSDVADPNRWFNAGITVMTPGAGTGTFDGVTIEGNTVRDVRCVGIFTRALIEPGTSGARITNLRIRDNTTDRTATDGIIWLLANRVPPSRITWVRPRDPWMLDRAVVQPDPAVAVGLAADTMAAAGAAESLDDMFLRLEAAGVMLRVDRDVTPTMTKTPTLARWELDQLRSIEDVVRLGHVQHVTRREIVLEQGSVPRPPGSVVVHCAASGLRYPPLVPIWSPDKIRLFTIRAGFPCFNAALAGYVEATRDDDRDRNRVCPPNTLPDTPQSWAAMQLRGALATRAYGAEPDIAAWANGCALNPARIEPAQREDPAVQAASARLADHVEAGLSGLAELAQPISGLDPVPFQASRRRPTVVT